MVSWYVHHRASSHASPLTNRQRHRCTQLAHSIYHLKPSSSASRYGSPVAKATAIFVPVIQVSLLRSKIVQDDLVVFYLVANVLSMFSTSPARHLQTR